MWLKNESSADIWPDTYQACEWHVIVRQSKLFSFVQRSNSQIMFKFFVLSPTEMFRPENDTVLG